MKEESIRFTLRIYKEDTFKWVDEQIGNNNRVINQTLEQYPELVAERNKLEEERNQLKRDLETAINILSEESRIAKNKQKLLNKYT